MGTKDIVASIRMGICCFDGNLGEEPGAVKAYDKLDGLVKEGHKKPTLGGYYVTTNGTRTIEVGPEKRPVTYRTIENLNVCEKHAHELFDGAIAGLSERDGYVLKETQEGDGWVATVAPTLPETIDASEGEEEAIE